MKNAPIPTRLSEPDEILLKYLAGKKGITNADFIRRAVSHLLTEISERSDWDWVEETARLPSSLLTFAMELKKSSAVQEILAAEDSRRGVAKRARKRA